MNISQLKALDATARAGSFTGAAEQLGITQPAVSRQLRELETLYQVKLFFRHGKQLKLTPLARELVRKARTCLAFIAEMEQSLLAEGGLQAGRFSIGLNCHHLVMELLATFMDRYPAVSVTSHIGDSEKLKEKVLDCQLDIAVITAMEQDPRLEYDLYSSQKIVAVVSKNHSWAALSAIDVGRMTESPMIARPASSGTRCVFDRQLAELQVRPRIALELDSFDAMLEATAANIGFSIVLEDEFKGDDRLCCIPFSGVRMIANQYLVYLPAYRDLNAVGFFLKLAAEKKIIKQFTQKAESA
jgi:DNA-binding transcriptional LysR family regulator